MGISSDSDDKKHQAEEVRQEQARQATLKAQEDLRTQQIFQQLQTASEKAKIEAKAALEASPQYQAQLAQKQADDRAANNSIIGGTVALVGAVTGAELLHRLDGVTPVMTLAGKGGVFSNESSKNGFALGAAAILAPQIKDPVMNFLTPSPAGGA